jgi:hypothetical protein
MQKTFLRTRISITVIFLFIGASVIPTAPTIINNSPKDSCDIPTWQMGDEWIYTADPVSYNSDSGSFIGRIKNFKREVVDIITITHDDEQIEVYQLDLTGDITGEISWEGLSGDLEGEVEGVSYIRVSDLAEVKTELVSTGIVQILFINRDYELIHTNKFFPPLELYDFPLKLYDQWEISCNVKNSGSFIIEGLVNEQYSESDMLDETLQCTKEIVSVPAGDFESYKITYPSDTYWYSPEVGNLVKSEVEQGYRDYTFNMDLSLESFSRGTQPINVTENLDPSEAIIDQEVVISGQAVNSDGDPIQNGDISIEIPIIGESWYTSTNDDGYYTITIEAPYIFDNTPSGGEFGSDGVIVRCSSGNLEGYKVKTLLIIDNFPPDPPNINGPNKGKKGVKYYYEFFSPDPDGDDMYYFVEWGDNNNSGWKGPYQDGEKMILNHTWSEKRTYTIRAKAKDSYDVESGWRELDVTITGNKILHNSLFEWLFDRFQDAFLILRYIFNL